MRFSRASVTVEKKKQWWELFWERRIDLNKCNMGNLAESIKKPGGVVDLDEELSLTTQEQKGSSDALSNSFRLTDSSH